MFNRSWLFKVSAMVLAMSAGDALGGGGGGTGVCALDCISKVLANREAVRWFLA